MVAMLIDTDPELAHQHALSASRRAGRIPVTRETLAVTAYRLGDFALALRELRTHRRLTGSQGHLALMVDCERGLGRPEKAIETGLQADVKALGTEDRVQLAIAMSGARLDLGQKQQALFELEIPELDPRKAYSWSPDLFAAYAAVLEDLGRDREARQWQDRSTHAAEALQQHYGAHDTLEVVEIYEQSEDHSEPSDESTEQGDESTEPSDASIVQSDELSAQGETTDTADAPDATVTTGVPDGTDEGPARNAGDNPQEA